MIATFGLYWIIILSYVPNIWANCTQFNTCVIPEININLSKYVRTSKSFIAD